MPLSFPVFFVTLCLCVFVFNHQCLIELNSYGCPDLRLSTRFLQSVVQFTSILGLSMRTTVLAIIAIISVPLLSLGQSTLSFPRVIQPADFSTTGYAIVNPGSAAATVTFNLYGADGGNPQISTQSIRAGGQLAKLASELFPNPPGAGWVQATSGTAGLQAFWFGGNLTTFADGAEAAASSGELVAPLIAPQSEINIANTGAADITVLLHLLDQNGFDLGFQPFPQRIPAKGFFKGDVAPLFFPIEDFSVATHMRIECRCANASYAATIIARDFIAGPSWAVANAVPASTATTALNFPHVVEGIQGPANWRSVIGITNLSTGSSNDVTIAFMSETGDAVKALQRTLPPNGGVRATIRDLLGLTPTAPFQNGWLRVTSTSGLPLTGYIAYAEATEGGVAVVPPQPEAQTNLLFEHIADLPPWLTGLALLNTNTRLANVEVFALRPDGSLIGNSNFPLAGGAKIAKLLSELIPQSQSRTTDGGFVFVRSDLPLFGIELFFSRNLQILSNVAAGKILPGINYVPPSR